MLTWSVEMELLEFKKLIFYPNVTTILLLFNCVPIINKVDFAGR